MTFYVDDMKANYGRMVMCHMIADTVDELHEMAARIGIQRRWFQASADHPHYDISLGKKKLAIQFGAKEITARECVKLLHAIYRQPDGGKVNR
jgi:hypothetical protein